MELPKPIQNFIKVFSSIPSIGPRQATRIAFWLLHQPKKKQDLFRLALNNLLQNVSLCPECFFVVDKQKGDKLCEICRNPQRDHSLICVVEKETDLLSLEKTNKYHGVYHVLGGLLSEIDNNQKNNLTINQLLARLQRQARTKQPVKEVILALSSTSEGNLTSYYLEKEIKKLGLKIKVTKLGQGLPHGGEVEFADAETLTNALERRH